MIIQTKNNSNRWIKRRINVTFTNNSLIPWWWNYINLLNKLLIFFIFVWNYRYRLVETWCDHGDDDVMEMMTSSRDWFRASGNRTQQLINPWNAKHDYSRINLLIGWINQQLKGLAQAKIIKKSVILFRLLNMTIWCKHVHRLELQIFIIFVLRIHQLG